MKLCFDCTQPAAPDRSRCVEHLAANLHAQRKRMGSVKGKKYLEQRNPVYAAYVGKCRRGHGRFNYVKANARKRKREFDLTREQYSTLISQPCFYCGFPNDVEISMGLDRLDNAGGYTLGNVASCCAACNLARNNNFTVDEMKIIGAAIRAVKLARTEETNA